MIIHIPGWFFYGSRLVFMVFQGSRLLFRSSWLVFHGSGLDSHGSRCVSMVIYRLMSVFMVPSRFFMFFFQGFRLFFMVPGLFYGFKRL